MANVRSRPDLERWLRDKPLSWARLIAARAALRALPYGLAYGSRPSIAPGFRLSLFRATFLTWEARDASSPLMTNAVARSAGALRDARAARSQKDNKPWSGGARSADAAAYAAARAADVVSTQVGDAESFAAFTARASSAVHAESFAAARADWTDPMIEIPLEESVPAYDEVWKAVERDCDWLTDNVDERSAQAIADQPLWLGRSPGHWRTGWDKAVARLLLSEPSYQLWVDWYDRRIVGDRSVFGIPGGDQRIKEWVVVTQIADADDEQFWNRGEAHVNATIKNWIEQTDQLLALPVFELIEKSIDAGSMERFSDGDHPATHADLRSALADLARELAHVEVSDAGIGHNRPPLESADSSDIAAVLQESRHAAEDIETAIETHPSDRREIARRLSRLQKIWSWLAGHAETGVKAYVKAVGTVSGAATGIALVSPGALDAIANVLKAGMKLLLSAP